MIDDCCNRCCFLSFFSLCVIGQYEPVFTAGSQPFVHHMNVYECVGDPSVFEVLAATEGSRCYQPSMPPLFFNCNNVVVAWTAGSEVCNKKKKQIQLRSRPSTPFFVSAFACPDCRPFISLVPRKLLLIVPDYRLTNVDRTRMKLM